MSRIQSGAWALSLGLFVTLCALVPLAACAPSPPAPNQGRQVWSGPGGNVASTGVTVYDRREIAQKVNLPSCLHVGEQRYFFSTVTRQPTTPPPGLTDTMFTLDRWRLWSDPGQAEGAPRLYVTVRGSTGLLAVYERVGGPAECPR